MREEIDDKRILIVDDMPENIDILVNALSDYKNIMVARSGEKALEIVESETRPDIILLDIVMEGIDGYDVCKSIREKKKYNDIGIIFITEYSNIKNETKGFELGASDYISKPINPEILKLRVKNQLQLKLSKNKLEEQNKELEERVLKRTEKLLEARKRAEKANTAKSEFMSNMSHEFRTPLSGIFGSLEILKELNDDPEKEKIYNMQMKSSKRLLDLIENLLSFQVLEENKFHNSEDEIDLNEIIEEIKSTHKKELEKKVWELKILNKIPKDKRIFASRIAIENIIYNILGNSIKFIKEGEINLEFELKNKTLIIYCRDTGIGIEEEKLKKIYRNFTQGEYYMSKRYSGLGIGLNIIMSLLKKINGEIDIESKENIGTKIEIKIPVEIY